MAKEDWFTTVTIAIRHSRKADAAKLRSKLLAVLSRESGKLGEGISIEFDSRLGKGGILIGESFKQSK